MTQSTFTRTSAPSSGLAGWALTKALAPLLRPWRQPRPLRPDELSDHWRRDLGLPERSARCRVRSWRLDTPGSMVALAPALAAGRLHLLSAGPEARIHRLLECIGVVCREVL